MDRWSGSREDPESLHRYLYAELRPTDRKDPAGLFTGTDLAITAAIVGVLATVLIYNVYQAYQAIPISVRLRPIILEGYGWSTDEAESLLANARSMFMRLATGISLSWSPVESERVTSWDQPTDSDLLDMFSTYYQTGTLPIIFLGYYKGESQYLPINYGKSLDPDYCESGLVPRGSTISRLTVDYNMPNAVPHELVHSVGCVGHHDPAGKQWLMNQPLYSEGTQLDEHEVKKLRRYARSAGH